jgi:tetratricopeptide (TPR) repeat protein
MYAAARTLVTAGKDLPRAEGYFRRYLQQPPEANTPSHAGAHWRLSQIYQKQGKKNEAIAELQTALSLDPNLEPAKKDLKALK